MYRRIGIVSCLVVLLLATIGRAAPARAASNRAALVVQFGDGYRIVRVVEFHTPTVTGMQLLQLSAVDAVTQGDLLICRIGPDGCAQQQDCFCAAPYYWSFFAWAPAGWRFICSGAASYTVKPGDVVALMWGGSELPRPIDPAPLFEPERLAPGIPQIVPDPAGVLRVAVDVQGDADGDGTVHARVRPSGGAWSEVHELRRTGDRVNLAMPGLPAVRHDIELQFIDADGVSGSELWRGTATISPGFTAYIPSIALSGGSIR
ncbi:MAG: hypothetical protein GX557_04760 [Chloroflexi bacterium]|nr:hypothetical protein [Chloroflexota bacterium]